MDIFYDMDPDPDPKFLISTRGSGFGSVINNFGSGTLAVVMILFLLSFYRVKARGLGRRIAWLDAHLYGKTEGRVSSTRPAGGSAHSGQDVPGSRPRRLLHLYSSIFGLHNNNFASVLHKQTFSTKTGLQIRIHFLLMRI